jgi:hypothetical protein
VFFQLFYSVIYGIYNSVIISSFLLLSERSYHAILETRVTACTNLIFISVLLPSHSSGGYSSASHRGDPGLTPVKSCGICGGQNGIEAGFLRVLRFPTLILIPLNSA